MTQSSVNFPLILLALLVGLAVRDVFANNSPQEDCSSTTKIPREQKLCNFNVAEKMYNATDLLLCLDELATNILLQQNVKRNGIANRAYQDTRQSYPTHPFAPDYSTAVNSVASSNYYGNQMLSSLLSGTLPLPNLSNLFDFSGLMRPNFNLFRALSSIAQYDDLKCVPRILCEVASGSMPGSLAYRQSSTFQNFGSNTLIGLLTAFDTSGSSPILTFGKAALLGYSNSGQSNMCYREYSRCPRNPDQLISYLNNYNGGFFRFFQGNQGHYYRPQQTSYGPYYKNTVQNRILQPTTEYENYPFSQSLWLPEEGGAETLTFANTNDFINEASNFFPKDYNEQAPNKVVFPKEDSTQSNRIIKSLNIFNDLNKEKVQTFFPREDESKIENYKYFNQPDYNLKPYFKENQIKENYIKFPHDIDYHFYL